MHVKRYLGTSLNDVLKKVRSDLGKDAIILKVRDEGRRGLWKLFGGGRAEIIAGTGFRVVGPSSPPAPAPRTPPVPRPVTIPSALPTRDGVRPDDLTREIREVKQLVSEVQKHVMQQRVDADTPRELFEEYLGLTSSRVSEALAQKVIRNLQARLQPEDRENRQIIRDTLQSTLEHMIPTGGPICLTPGRPRRVAFIGPTGVGKTTTIAKLAGAYAVLQHKKVALLTNDTYRIAASDQLRKIAEIIQQHVDIPFRVVSDGASARAALEDFADRDLVLMDTAGRGQRDASKMDELRAFLEAVKPDETHLVVSLTTHPDTMLDIVERFSGYPIDRLVVTKLDEAAKFGLLLDVLAKVNTSLSYVTTGQRIPDDIRPANARWLAERMMAGPLVKSA